MESDREKNQRGIQNLRNNPELLNEMIDPVSLMILKKIKRLEEKLKKRMDEMENKCGQNHSFLNDQQILCIDEAVSKGFTEKVKKEVDTYIQKKNKAEINDFFKNTQDAINGLRDELKNLKNGMAGITKDIEDLKTKYEKIEIKLNLIEDCITAIGNDIKNLRQTIAEENLRRDQNMMKQIAEENQRRDKNMMKQFTEEIQRRDQNMMKQIAEENQRRDQNMMKQITEEILRRDQNMMKQIAEENQRRDQHIMNQIAEENQRREHQHHDDQQFLLAQMNSLFEAWLQKQMIGYGEKVK